MRFLCKGGLPRCAITGEMSLIVDCQQMPGNVVVVTFARNTAQTELNDNNNFGKDFGKEFGKDFGKELTDRQRIILKMLAEDGSLSAKSLSEKISEKNSGKKLTDRD